MKRFFGGWFYDVADDRLNNHRREQWIASKLKALPAGTKLLDAGAGECAHKKYCDHLNYLAQDFCAYKGDEPPTEWGGKMAVWDTSQIDIISDICDIPLEDASMDAVLCTEVLEHVPDPLAALHALMRLVRPGGQLILTAPFVSNSHQQPYHFATGFSHFFYKKHLSEAGFDILELTANGNYFEHLAQETYRSLFVTARRYRRWYRPLFWVHGVITMLMLWRLWGENKRNSGTEDFLCFGFFVVARKQHAP